MYTDLFAVIAPVFLCAAVGYGWAKSGNAFPSDFVTTLITNIGTPCLVLATLTKMELSTAAVGEMAMAAALALAAFALIGAAILRLAGWPFGSFLPALIFANAGNMGLPLSLFAFGEDGLALAIVYFTVSSCANFTFGQWIAAGHGRAGLLIRTPLVYAVVAGLVLAAFDVRLPRWISNTLDLMGGLTIPLMLITLGVSLAQLRVTKIRRSVGVSLLRLGMGAGVGFGLGWALGLEGAAYGVFVLQSAMPVAVYNYLFAQRYGRAADEVAGTVIVSTVIGFALLPLLLPLIMP